MIKKLNIEVPHKLYEEATLMAPVSSSGVSKIVLSRPTGDFFYDPWELRPEYVNTVWDNLLQFLPKNIGEARLICLGIERCYTAHADIDNRYHFGLGTDNSFLIDLDAAIMHKLEAGSWFYMDAGRLHSAANFDSKTRVSLVVRELLNKCTLSATKRVTIIADTSMHDHRFVFDQEYSRLLNLWQTNKQLSSFSVDNNVVSFLLEKDIQVPRISGFEVIEE